MLQYLRVKNLAIVESVQVEFETGLNVVTGETGAGKSVIIGALNLILGERADKTMIRAGEDRCSVEAEFALSDPEEVDVILEDLGLEPCEDGRLIIRRVISGTGTGKNLVNDSSVTLQALKQIGDEMKARAEEGDQLQDELQRLAERERGLLETIQTLERLRTRSESRLEQRDRAMADQTKEIRSWNARLY